MRFNAILILFICIVAMGCAYNGTGGCDTGMVDGSGIFIEDRQIDPRIGFSSEVNFRLKYALSGSSFRTDVVDLSRVNPDYLFYIFLDTNIEGENIVEIDRIPRSGYDIYEYWLVKTSVRNSHLQDCLIGGQIIETVLPEDSTERE